MNWREQLALLFGAASPFALLHDPALAAPNDLKLRSDQPVIDRDQWVYTDPAAKDRLLLFAGHSSHRSHSSHSSHSSHYSGSGGHSSHASHASHASHYSGSGSYSPPPPAPPAPSRPYYAPSPYLDDHGVAPLRIPPAASPASRPTQQETREFVRNVQMALTIQGYSPGPADGVLGPGTRAALRQFQQDSGLPATGFMDVATLRRLSVLQGPTAGVITNPEWLRRPGEEDMARYYPDRAMRMDVEGTATLSCTVSSTGTLADCTIVSEEPGDYGFGDAALKLSRLFRMRAQTQDGSPTAGKTVRLPIRFVLPDR